MEIASLKGPTLFAHLAARKAVNFSPSAIVTLHDEISREFAAGILSHGGPRTMPITALALPLVEYSSIVGGAESIAIGAPTVEPVVTGLDPRSGMTFALYCTDLLETPPPGTNQVNAGTYILSTVASNLIAQAVGRATHSPFGLSVRQRSELAVIAEGFGTYFSGHPIDVDHLVSGEYLNFFDLKPLDPFRQMYRSLVGDRHFFGGLALAKIEMAFGFQAIIDLINNIPGTSIINKRYKVENPALALWEMYFAANNAMGLPSLPYEFFEETCPLLFHSSTGTC
jgi:hypothetical protein